MAENAGGSGTHHAVAQEDEDFELIDIDHVLASNNAQHSMGTTSSQTARESGHGANAHHEVQPGKANQDVPRSSGTVTKEDKARNEEEEEEEEEELKHATAESLIRLGKGPASYRALLRRLAAEMPVLPACNVELRCVSAVVNVPVAEQDHAIPNLARSLLGMLKSVAAVGKKANTRPVYRLHNVSLTFPAGTTTLILAPPGHGKTSILQTIAGIVQPTSGEVLYSGSSAEGMEARVPRLTAYVGQDDVHMPQLTVRETLTFAAQNANVAAHLPNTELMRRYTEERVELMLRILGLTNCADTIVGNDLVRGVSGGEKRRVSIGEQLITNARCLLLDQYSTGLDASTTIDITRSLSSWAHLTGGTVAATMLQPPPEVVDMYDNVVVLREGQVVYAGPRRELRPYFQRAGFYCPPEMDTADIVTEVVTHPSKWVAKYKHEQPQRRDDATDASVLDSTVSKTDKPPVTTAQMRDEYEHQERQLSMATRPSDTLGASSTASDARLRNDFSRAQYGRPHAKSFAQHFVLCAQRQFRLMRRDPQFLVAHLVQSLFLALILGSLFWQLGTNEFQLRVGLLLFVPTLLAFNNMAEVPVAMAAREIVYRQQHAGLYPTLAYTLAVNFVHLPLAIVESVVFSCGVYWMTGFVDEGDRFLFFLFVLCIVASATAAMFRAISYAVPSMELGQVMIGPTNGMLVMFCGITITRSNIPPWFIWIYYFSPFSWAIRTLAINEFQSDRYAAPAANATDSSTLGELYLKSYEFQVGDEWKWLGVLYLAGFLVVMVAIGNLVLSRGKPDGSRGTSRVEETDDENLHLSYADDENSKTEQQLDEATQGMDGKGSAAIVDIRSTLAGLDAASTTEDDNFDAVADGVDAGGTSNVSGQSGRRGPTTAASTTIGSSPNNNDSNDSSSNRNGRSVQRHRRTLPIETASLVFRDLCYDVVVKKDRKQKETKRLLNKVTGYARAGELTALMGVTGAGKTTLLDVLARRKTGGTANGSVLVNGRVPSSSRFARMVGYCEQNDLHEPYTTVEEALHFSAALRLPTSVDEVTRMAFVEEIMELIELKHLRDRLVGVPGQDNGLSQGQRKRLTLGVELVANTSILFLDEPTSQLDSREAEVVMRVVRNVARTGRTVVCTIHQPNAELFAMFDQLLLLARGGRAVFHGPLSNLQPYLEAIPGVEPKARHINPATWMLDVIGASSAGVADDKVQAVGTAGDEEAATEGAGGPSSSSSSSSQGADVPPSRFPGIYEQSEARRAVEAEVQRLVKEGKSGTEVGGDHTRAEDKKTLARRSKAQKMGLVLRRTFVSYWRNVDYNFTRIVVILLQTLLFGLLYLDVDESTLAGVVSRMAAIFSVAMFCGSIHLLTAIPVVVGARPVVAREQAGRMYSGWMHSVSLGVVEVPYLLVSGVASAAIFYFMAGLSLDTEPLILYFLAHTVLGFVLAYLSQLLSNTFPSAEAATLGASTVLSMMFLFGGLFLPGPDMPNGYRWIWYANFLKHALTTMVVPQFHCDAPTDNSTASACPTIDFATAEGVVQVTTSDYVQDFLGVNYTNRWDSMFALVAYAVGFLIFAILAARFLNHVKR